VTTRTKSPGRGKKASRADAREQTRRQLFTALSAVADLLEGIAGEIEDGRFTDDLDSKERDNFKRAIIASTDVLRFDLPSLLPNVLDDIPDCLTKLSRLLELDEGGA